MLNQAMVKGFSAVALSLATAAVGAPSAWAGKGNFWVTNISYSHIDALYITESSISDWGTDITGPGVLGSDSSMQILFGNPRGDVCYYDIRAEFSDGAVLEEYEVNVCAVDEYTFFDTY